MKSTIAMRVVLATVISATALAQLGCATRKTRAEAAAAESYEDPESSPQTIAPEPAEEPAPAEPAAEPAPAEPGAAAPAGAAPAAAGEDDVWTEDTSPTVAPASAAAANQAETRTPEVIRKFVLERREKVRPCYDRAQAGRPNFKGDVMMRFVLSPSGMVQKIEYSAKESTLYAPDVGECIAKEMKTWQFPASSRGMETKVGYPFNFNPRSK